MGYECCCIRDEAKIGGPSISVPYFAMSYRIVSGIFLSIGTFPISSKNFSNPPGWHIRINFLSVVAVFALLTTANSFLRLAQYGNGFWNWHSRRKSSVIFGG